MTPRAVIFDLWNTLIPFDHELERRELVAIADAFGVAPGEFKREWRSGYERRLVSDLRGSFDRVRRSLGVTRAGAVDEAFRLRIEMHREMFVPREDAVATLKELHARGYLTGLLTNCSSEVPELVAESPLAGLFDVEIYSCSVGLRKPERAIYELAANGLGIEPRLCLYIGDGGDDELSGARAFGMTAVLLKPGDTQPPEEWEGPEITRLAQVLELLGERPRNSP